MTVKIGKSSNVAPFIEMLSHYDGNVYANQGKYTVNAKSILGIFSLNIEEYIELVFDSWQPSLAYMDALGKIVDQVLL